MNTVAGGAFRLPWALVGEKELAMTETPDHRRAVRLTLPWPLREPEVELRFVRLLDLSPDGARIEHLAPLRAGSSCAIDLPPALGRLRLTGRVVWSGIRGREQTLEGERRLHYQSGIDFTDLTPQQQTALAAALAKIRAAQAEADRAASR